MGFLVESEPLDWHEALNKLQYVRDHGVEQFLHVFHQVKFVQEDLLRWGDEVEHAVIKLVGNPEDENRTAKISIRAPEIIQELKDLEAHGRLHGLSEADMSSWMPEYGRWMLESTPRKPYEGLTDLLNVESRMRLRRSRIMAALRPGEVAPTMTSFPLLGVGDCCEPSCAVNGPVAQSLFVPDEAIFPHARFATLTKNIRMRRGSKVDIRRPRFEDENTPEPVHTCPNFVPSSVEEADGMDHVYADAMAFGMGCCCLQVTFQASNVNESRHIYDHLAVLTPIMLALTAATPFMRGWLIDEDSRWSSVSQAVDDRTPAEQGDTGGSSTEGEGDRRLAGAGQKFLRKSRYDSIDCYLCNCKGGKQDPANMYNDLGLVYTEEHVQRLTKSGIDEVLARHIAHLFARDPLVIYRDRLYLDDRVDIDHWENLQSTNWQTVRWKPPPPNKGILDKTSEEHIGWRVEFRSMELQLTDFENAANTVFVVLLSRVILALELSLYIPISRLEENMQSAQRREAVTSGKFWFRKNILPLDPAAGFSPMPRVASRSSISVVHVSDTYTQMTIGEILGGTEDFPGLIPLCETYLDFIGADSVIRNGLQRYMDFILMRARGELMTTATWMRKFITSHPTYRKDSRIPHAAAYDLMVACQEIGTGARKCPELLGHFEIPTVEAATNLSRTQPQMSDQRKKLLDRFHKRAHARRLEKLDRDVAAKEIALAAQMKDLENLRELRKLESERFRAPAITSELVQVYPAAASSGPAALAPASPASPATG